MPFQFLGYEGMKEDFSRKMDTYAGFKGVAVVAQIPADRLKYIMFVKSVITLLDQEKFPHTKKASPEEIAKEKSVILSGILYALAQQLYKRGSQLAASFEAVILGEQSLNTNKQEQVSKSFDTKHSKLGMIDDCEAFKMLETAERFYIHNVFKEGKLKKGRLEVHALVQTDPRLTMNFSTFEKTLVDLKQKNNGGIYTASWDDLNNEKKHHKDEGPGLMARFASIFSTHPKSSKSEAIMAAEPEIPTVSDDVEISGRISSGYQ